MSALIARSTRVGVDWARAHQQALGRVNLPKKILGQISQKLSHAFLQFHQCVFSGRTRLAAGNLAYNPAAEPSPWIARTVEPPITDHDRSCMPHHAVGGETRSTT
jgi:hypothetical protein